MANNGNEFAIPELLSGSNPKIPAVSQSVILDYKPETGRRLVVSYICFFLPAYKDYVLGCSRY